MSTALTIAGGVLQFVGLGFVFAELAVIRSQEFGVPTPWAWLASWVRRLLHRPQVVSVGAASAATSGGWARAKVRPGPLEPDAAPEARIAWLERYVVALDGDLDGVHQTIERKAAQVLEQAQRRDEKIRQEIDRRDAERREALRPSLVRQALGGLCVLAGTVLATIGGLGATTVTGNEPRAGAQVSTQSTPDAARASARTAAGRPSALSPRPIPQPLKHPGRVPCHVSAVGRSFMASRIRGESGGRSGPVSFSASFTGAPDLAAAPMLAPPDLPPETRPLDHGASVPATGHRYSWSDPCTGAARRQAPRGLSPEALLRAGRRACTHARRHADAAAGVRLVALAAGRADEVTRRRIGLLDSALDRLLGGGL
jgi:hypothetical protein